MPIKVIEDVAPDAEPVTLAEAKLHLKVDVDDDDALILSDIATAREHAEHYTERAWGERTLELALDAFPAGAIALPLPPVVSITSIKYIDPEGIEQTIAAEEIRLNDYGMTASVERITAWPSTKAETNAVKVRYVAGSDTIPQAVRAAILVFIGHLYEERCDAGEIPATVRRLLDTVKVY